MPDRPNILLITGDHLNWNTICRRSVCRTPNINRLADAGLSFGRSYTAVSLCCPSRAMLLSGAYPWHNGVYNQVHVPESVHPDMFDDVQTYSQRLARAAGISARLRRQVARQPHARAERLRLPRHARGGRLRPRVPRAAEGRAGVLAAPQGGEPARRWWTRSTSPGPAATAS